MSALSDCIKSCCDRPGLNTVRLRRIFTLMVQDFFSNPVETNDEYREELACLKYSTDPKESQLYIGPTHAVGGADRDDAAGVYISVAEMRLDKIAIGDLFYTSPDGATSYYGKKAIAHMRFRCKHQDPDVALMMAESILIYLTACRKMMGENLPGLLEYDLVALDGLESDRPKPESRFRADVSLRIVYQMVVAVTEESHRLKKFGFAVSPT